MNLWDWVKDAKKVFMGKGVIGHTDEITQVALFKNEGFVVSSSRDRTAILWNTDGTIRRRVKHNTPVLAIDVSTKSGTIVSGSEDGIVKIWDVKSQSNEFSFVAHRLAINAICFAPDGNSFLTASNDKTICQWDLKGNLIKKYSGHLKPIIYANFISGHVENILSMSSDATSTIWNNADYSYKSFKIQKSINPPLVSVSSVGDFFLAGGDNGKFVY